MSRWVITITCEDRPGIVHAITGAIVATQGNIEELQQFSSLDSGRFFMRLEVDTPVPEHELRATLAAPAHHLGAEVHTFSPETPTRTLILVSKAAHTLNDLLFAQRSGHLNVHVPIIVGNHPDLAPLAQFYGAYFEHHAVLPETKVDVENRLRQIIHDHGIELVVLARYMQVLSPELCETLRGKAINIHHSFLPGFKGANPYRQAHQRGVKLIGATAHFVTPDLDEGPIIEQNVTRVDHSMPVAKLVDKGQGLESATLTEAVRLFSEHRIFTDGQRTVIFR